VLYRAKSAACPEINKKHLNKVWAKCRILSVKPAGVTSNKEVLKG
jgi:hypothetical protein